MRRGLFIACLVMLCLGGCSTTQSVKDAEGQGVKRTYEASYVAVFDATVAAAKRNGLQIIESNKIAGRLVLSRGVSWTSLGERIAVFFKPPTPTATEVEIVSKGVAPVSFSRDWEKVLLDQIEQELQRRK